MNTISLYLILAPSRTGIASYLEVCNAVHLANVLFLPVMYSISGVIYRYSQTWDFGSVPRSGTSQADPGNSVGRL
jgi:hypothetical protein